MGIVGASQVAALAMIEGNHLMASSASESAERASDRQLEKKMDVVEEKEEAAADRKEKGIWIATLQTVGAIASAVSAVFTFGAGAVATQAAVAAVTAAVSAAANAGAAAADTVGEGKASAHDLSATRAEAEAEQIAHRAERNDRRADRNREAAEEQFSRIMDHLRAMSPQKG